MAGGIGPSVVATAVASSSRVAATGIPAWITATWITTAWIASSAVATLREVLVLLFALEIDGIDDGVGALRRFDGFDESLSAAAVTTIRQDDDGFAAGLFAHQLVGSQKEGVVECGTASTARPPGSIVVVVG